MPNLIPDSEKKRLDSLFEAFSIVAEGTYVFLCNMKYDYSRWSESAVSSFALPSEYMYGAGEIWEEHIHPEDRESYHRSIAQIFSGEDEGHDMQYRARRKDGEYDVCTCRGVVIRDEEGNPHYFGGAIRNHGVQGQIDTLIGLRNQYGFFDDLESHILKNNPVRICMIGIGQFTEINEIYGYLFGNRVLQCFGRFLFEKIGNEGSVYRLDGTKFAFITNRQNTKDIAANYERLRAHFRDGFSVDDKQLILDLNAGLLDLDNFSVDVQTVYACLNFAYGESKIRRQGDLVEFLNDLNDENRERIEKYHVIRVSITQQYQGFKLFYQPVVDAKTEKLTGAEALIRWESPEYGLVMPDHFVPLLERDSLFPELGRWILKTALLDAKKLLQSHPDFVVNVNLSYAQLEKVDFVDMVLEVLAETEYPPENLCLEITERCRLLDMTLLKNVIVNLRGRGVKFALDDFGTGFSSMGILKNLTFDTIKIDRSFVMKIEEDEKEREMVEHFSSVAATFGSKVCIEGVETAGMRDILRQYHVHSFQGYFYSRPVDFDHFRAWMEERK